MPDEFDSDAVRSGRPLAHVREARFAEPLPLSQGGELAELTVAYETYGELNAEGDNAVLLCHAISGDSHAARHSDGDDPGWWEELVGPGKAVDTNKLFVVCTNVVGGCRGTTGPASVDPATGQRYGRHFPTVTVNDMVDAQHRLMRRLGLSGWRAVVGGSLGGHQAIAWATRYPDCVGTAVVLASSPRLSAQALAFEVVGRNAVQSDPNYNDGNYYTQSEQPAKGLAIARMLGHITYLSSEAMTKRFDADRHTPPEIDTDFEKRFSVGSYLAHQGERFTERFDANSYCAISMALSLVDFGADHQALSETLSSATCDWLVISFSSDWLFTPAQSRQIVTALTALGKPVSYCEIPTDAGHDGFLLKNEIADYGPLVAAKLGTTKAPPVIERSSDDVLLSMIGEDASVVDLGCGDGHLLARLSERGSRRLCGVDVKTQKLVSTALHGVDVIDADLNQGLPHFADGQFDIAVVSSTLQMVPNVKTLLQDSLRVANKVLISFPNFGYAPLRRMFAEEGRSPMASGDYSYEWYETPNKRFPTVRDLMSLCESLGLQVSRAHYHQAGVALTPEQLLDPNLHAETAVLLVEAAPPSRTPTSFSTTQTPRRASRSTRTT